MSPLLNLALFLLAVALAVGLYRLRRARIARGRPRRSLTPRVLLEDALKHVYNHDASGRAPTIETLAGALEISTSRAVALLDRLDTAGLARFSDGRLVLTGDGRRYAVDVIRAHRLWERYLADETGLDPMEWHSRAEKQEHRLTREQADALSERLGHPRYDPHGDPIPTADGDVFDGDVVALAALDVGERAVVAHVEDEPHAVYAQLVALGVYPGMEVRVREKSDQRIEIEADGRPMVMAPVIAQNVSARRTGSDVPEAESPQTLASLQPGESAEVVRVSPACRGLERRRLMDLGVVPGTRITLERRGLTGGLSAYMIRDTVIGLREEQARMIAVRRHGHAAAVSAHGDAAPAAAPEGR